MNESDVRLRLHHALQYRGYWPLHHRDGFPCPKCGTIQVPPIKGRPDTEARHTKFPIAMIEVKALGIDDLAFAFKEISEDQRKYLTAWMNEGGQSYLCLGKIVPLGSKTSIHSIWVIPWDQWLDIEKHTEKSIIYDRSFYTNNVRPGEHSVTDVVPDKYKLFGAGLDWHFQNEHPLAVQPEVEMPFFKRVKAKSILPKEANT